MFFLQKRTRLRIMKDGKRGDAMFGAIYGDVIGSYYEVHCTKAYDFPLMAESSFTDDSVLIAAVCRAILDDPQPISRGSASAHASMPQNTASITPIFRMPDSATSLPSGQATREQETATATGTAPPCV